MEIILYYGDIYFSLFVKYNHDTIFTFLYLKNIIMTQYSLSITTILVDPKYMENYT